MFDLAAQSRDVVQKHLENVPGESYADCSTSIPTTSLFLILRRRAAASLHGVNITADRRDFYFPGTPVNISASCITSINSCIIALVLQGGSLVRLYEVFQGELKLRRILCAELNKKTKYRPVQTAFDQINYVYVLYSSEKAATVSVRSSQPYNERWTELGTRASLTRVKLSALSCPQDSWDIDEVKRKDSITKAKFVRPVSMAAHDGDKVSIAWDYNICVDHTNHLPITVYTLLNGDGFLT